MYEPSENVVKMVTRPNWKINDGIIDRDVTLIVTPNVVVSFFQIKKIYFVFLKPNLERSS
jgi:hypothetical protein